MRSSISCDISQHYYSLNPRESFSLKPSSFHNQTSSEFSITPSMDSPFPPNSINDFSDDTQIAPQDFATFGNAEQAPAYQQDYYPLFPPGWNLTDTSVDPRNLPQNFADYSQQPNQQFQRALSTSSATNSPYSRASSVQYPAPFPSQPGGQHLSQLWDNYHSPALAAQHLPTPTRTPTRESFMERKESRRTPARPQGDASAGVQGSRGGLGGQWATNGQNAPNGLTPEVQYGPIGNRGVPTFDRTMTDAYADELYNPSASGQSNNIQRRGPQNNTQHSPSSVINERLQAAQLARSSSPGASRGPSPFRQGSPYAVYGQNHVQIHTASEMRQQQKREADALAYQQHHTSQNEAQPTTVSPKDAFPEQPEPEEENMPPLFPQVSNQSFPDPPTYGPQGGASQSAYGASMPATRMAFGNPAIMSGAQFQDIKYGASVYDNEQTNDMGNQYGSMQGGNGDAVNNFTPLNIKTENEESMADDNQRANAPRPIDARANSGTYSCTYHGCTSRFETPQQLQKHKREGHRGAGARHRHSSSDSPVQNSDSPPMHLEAMSQAGPHKCTRINPTTGRPCNTIFSRPYDLTRHEYSLHSAEKKKLRCQYCTEEKLFSRQDALTRHTRVCHQEVAVPGKARRRHVQH